MSITRTIVTAFVGFAASSASADTTNWVAFNDHTPGTTAGWATSPNATAYNMRGVSGGNAGTVLSGSLKDITTGTSVPAVLTSSAVGTPDDFGSSGYPNAGTPAYVLFNGKVDLGNSQSMIGIRSSSGSRQILTFSNLDPSKRYILKGTSVRGNNYTGRWTLVSLQGADSWTDDHSAAVYTAGNYTSAGLTNGQAGYWSGENRADGAVVGWKDISPGADGTFNVLCQQWAVNPLPNGVAPDTANYGYGFNGIMLAEVEVGAPQPPLITSQPVNVTTNEGAAARLTVVASGSGSLSYQWYRNGSAISGATTPSLMVTNMNGASPYPWSQPSDSGNYSVVVTGSINPPATSSVAVVTINPDSIAPSLLWAIQDTNSLGATIIRIAVSEELANNVNDYIDNFYWNVRAVSGPGGDIAYADSVILTHVTNGTVITPEIQLEFNTPFTVDPDTTYRIYYENSVPLIDRAQTPNQMADPTVLFHSHTATLLAFDDSWKYSDVDLAAPSGWQLPGFNDSDTSFWKSGPGPFDAKRGTPPCRATSEVNFDLPPVGTCIVITNLANAANTNDIPSYYFRTHFNYSGQVQSNLMLRLRGKFDDGGVVFLNGVEIARVGIDASNALTHANYNVSRPAVGNDAPDAELLFPGNTLHSGDNVVAVYLGQVNGTSSDITMGLRITATAASPVVPAVSAPSLSISTVGADVRVSWTPLGGSLLEATSVTGPFTTNTAATNPYQFTPSGAQRYFRVAQ